MAADASETRELERAEENDESSPILTLETALRREPNPSSRIYHNDSPRKFQKNNLSCI
jgi:hypothetical protein